MIADALTFFGTILLIGIFLIKLLNVMNEAKNYDWKQCLVLVLIGAFAWLFAFAATMTSFSTITYSFMLNVCTFTGLTIVIMTVAEIIFYLREATLEGLSRFKTK